VNRGDRTREWALLGAQLQLVQLDRERAEILAAFPELRSQRRGRIRGPLTAAARRRLSAGMRRYWAARKAKGRAKG
jgi:hypothetical protein